MLTHLSIQGLAIIDQLTIDFTSGFNVITGETGAGKSILIKALSLLLGGKASQESVRRGCEQATVTGRFMVRAGHPALANLRSIGALAAATDQNFEVMKPESLVIASQLYGGEYV
ncbi:MAG: AAA family ATPase, partial [bacterium]